MGLVKLTGPMDQNPTPSSTERGVDCWGFKEVLGLKERKKRRLEMANWASAGRSTSNIMRAALRATKKSASPTARVSVSQFSSPIRLPNLTLHCHSRISSSRLVRRELSSLLPVHSAIASACLVSKLPSEVSTSSEGLSFQPLLSFISLKWNEWHFNYPKWYWILFVI